MYFCNFFLLNDNIIINIKSKKKYLQNQKDSIQYYQGYNYHILKCNAVLFILKHLIGCSFTGGGEPHETGAVSHERAGVVSEHHHGEPYRH